jgi:hypothetical protein
MKGTKVDNAAALQRPSGSVTNNRFVIDESLRIGIKF